jgi:hypothetical protein
MNEARNGNREDMVGSLEEKVWYGKWVGGTRAHEVFFYSSERRPVCNELSFTHKIHFIAFSSPGSKTHTRDERYLSKRRSFVRVQLNCPKKFRRQTHLFSTSIEEQSYKTTPHICAIRITVINVWRMGNRALAGNASSFSGRTRRRNEPGALRLDISVASGSTPRRPMLRTVDRVRSRNILDPRSPVPVVEKRQTLRGDAIFEN